jgi:hypothetical protein
VRLLVAVLALAAAVFGVAGGGTLLVEHRLAGLTPGGVDFGALSYNPFTGHLRATDVRARDAARREVFRADGVAAEVNPVSLLGGLLSLGRVRVSAPRLTLRGEGVFALDDVSAGLGAAQRLFGSQGGLALPVHVADLVVDGGTLTVEGAGEGGGPLVVHDLDLRLSRLTTATVDGADVAFAVEMAVYGSIVHVTGQPRGGGYVLHVRARGLDGVALARDVPVPMLAALERGQAEVDADFVLADGRVLASGFVRLTDAVLRLPVADTPRLSATSLAVAADAFDLTTGAGRLTRVDVVAPVLALPKARAAAMLDELVAGLRDDPDLLVRRVSVSDGTLTLDGPDGIRISRLQLTAQLPERRADSGWVVSARAALGDDAEASLDGLIARDLRGVDAITRLVRVPLAPWRALAGTPAGWDARVSFNGRLRLVAREGDTVATAAGQAELSDVSGAGGFRAERVVLGIRRLRWPGMDAIFDRVVLTRPALGLRTLKAWTASQVTSGVSVVDGELTGDGPGNGLRQLAVDLAADDAGGLARLRLSASTAAGGRVDLDRVVAYAAGETGLPLGLLAVTLDEAARSTAIAPSALPASVIP